MSDDELFKRLGLINNRLSWASSYSHCGQLVQQLQMMHAEVIAVIEERVERINMKNRLDAMPDVLDISAPLKSVTAEDSNSRAKSKSDIIGRLRRTSSPVTSKDS